MNGNVLKGAGSALKNITPPVAEALVLMGAINPGLGVLALGLVGVIGCWGDYANEKSLDLIKEFIDNKERIFEDIVASEKFKAVAIRVFSENITESNEEKRRYLKNYILNMACGVNPGFTEHTKMINVLNNITLEEIDMLMLWDKDNAIDHWVNKENLPLSSQRRQISLTIADIGNCATSFGFSSRLSFGREDQSKNNQILLRLGYSGLLWVLSQDNFGSGQEVKVKEITEFGKSFLEFIKR